MDIKKKIDEARLLVKSENLAEALRLYLTLSVIDKSNSQFQFHIGKLYSALGNHEQAARFLKRALQADPTELKGWEALIGEYALLDNEDKIKEATEAAKSLGVPKRGLGSAGLGPLPKVGCPASQRRA